MDSTQMISLLILLVLVLADTVAFSDGLPEGQDLPTPPNIEQETVPPHSWDPAWHYERRFA